MKMHNDAVTVTFGDHCKGELNIDGTIVIYYHKPQNSNFVKTSTTVSSIFKFVWYALGCNDSVSSIGDYLLSKIVFRHKNFCIGYMEVRGLIMESQRNRLGLIQKLFAPPSWDRKQELKIIYEFLSRKTFCPQQFYGLKVCKYCVES
jgi:hypothetical protein